MIMMEKVEIEKIRRSIARSTHCRRRSVRSGWVVRAIGSAMVGLEQVDELEIACAVGTG